MRSDILIAIAQQYNTPAYVYDLDRIKTQYAEFKAAFDWPKLKICYAMKANFNKDIIGCLAALGSGIDAVSPGDLYMAQSCGIKINNIIYTANNITDAEMNEVADTGVLMNIGSLSRLEKYAKAFPNTRVCLRINPDVVDGAHDKIKTGGDLTKFGILLEDVDKVSAITRAAGLKVVGLHEHTGSGLQNPDSIIQAMNQVMTIATPTNFPDLEFLDFGGGFKVPYGPDESPIDLKSMGKAVCQVFSQFCNDYGRELELWFEPGKFLTAQAGSLLVKVNTIKRNRHRTICGTDSGFPQLIRPMFYNAYHAIDNLSNPQGSPQVYDICGNICETGDLFAKDRTLPRIRENDLLVIQNAGAYCYAMGGNYNLRPMPAEVVVENNEYRLSRRRLSSEELVAMITGEFEKKRMDPKSKKRPDAA
ncbi:MAG: diaminopimelate decarboxylase [Desulfobacter sp.]|nr:diaminopimelate decarboxylase [Desulfobacter sp.]WDP85064.1 MAG: diaminopimelate decarboxylase [Desulfobacter sp.]